MTQKKINSIDSVSELHQILSFPNPEHPLITLLNLSKIKDINKEDLRKIIFNLYCITILKNFKGKLKYGQKYYDYGMGTMSFTSPGQVLSVEFDDKFSISGFCLIFHPDFIRNYPLGKQILSYGFFSYDVNEALHLSKKEEIIISSIMKKIQSEFHSTVDIFSQNIMVNYIELLLNQCNRLYNKQFITQKHVSNDLLAKLEVLLDEYFKSDHVQKHGLPTVQYISKELNVSPNYLSDMLRIHTGQSTQQHIHDKLIENAKQILVTTSLSVNEIAFQLGFEYPQYFSRLFKKKTNYSPLEYRNSFN